MKEYEVLSDRALCEKAARTGRACRAYPLACYTFCERGGKPYDGIPTDPEADFMFCEEQSGPEVFVTHFAENAGGWPHMSVAKGSAMGNGLTFHDDPEGIAMAVGFLTGATGSYGTGWPYAVCWESE